MLCFSLCLHVSKVCAWRVKGGLRALNIHTDNLQLAAAGVANKGVYIVNYVTAERWEGGIHLNNGRNDITAGF